MMAGKGAVAIGAALSTTVLVAGCVDPLVNRPRGEVEHWTGLAEAVETSAGRCRAVELELFRDALAIGGTARELEGPAEETLATAGRWWVEGTVNPNGTFLFTLRRQGPLLGEGPRPASVWRGRFGTAEVVAVEQPPSCGRRVRLVREAGDTAGS